MFQDWAVIGLLQHRNNPASRCRDTSFRTKVLDGPTDQCRASQWKSWSKKYLLLRFLGVLPRLLISVRKPSSRHLYIHSTEAVWECGEMRTQWELITLPRPLRINPSSNRPWQCDVTTTTIARTIRCRRATPKLQRRRLVRETTGEEREQRTNEREGKEEQRCLKPPATGD